MIVVSFLGDEKETYPLQAPPGELTWPQRALQPTPLARVLLSPSSVGDTCFIATCFSLLHFLLHADPPFPTHPHSTPSDNLGLLSAPLFFCSRVRF